MLWLLRKRLLVLLCFRHAPISYNFNTRESHSVDFFRSVFVGKMRTTITKFSVYINSRRDFRLGAKNTYTNWFLKINFENQSRQTSTIQRTNETLEKLTPLCPYLSMTFILFRNISFVSENQRLEAPGSPCDDNKPIPMIHDDSIIHDKPLGKRIGLALPMAFMGRAQ